jgi:hypothetical protein
MSVPPSERLLERIRAEYLEMPGLCLTSEQVQRLCGLERKLCQLVLDSNQPRCNPIPRGHFNRWGATGLVAVASC